MWNIDQIDTYHSNNNYKILPMCFISKQHRNTVTPIIFFPYTISQIHHTYCGMHSQIPSLLLKKALHILLSHLLAFQRVKTVAVLRQQIIMLWLLINGLSKQRSWRNIYGRLSNNGWIQNIIIVLVKSPQSYFQNIIRTFGTSRNKEIVWVDQ